MTNETLDLFEARIAENLVKLQTEEDEKERSRLIYEVEKLSTQLTDAEGLTYKFASDQAQRELDDEKSKRSYEAEVVKTRIDWKRAAIEVGKVAIPAVVSLISLKTWTEAFNVVGDFEQTGSWRSTPFRILGFPKIVR